jgi:hypothetical protein
MYAHTRLVSSVRGSGSGPTMAAKLGSGRTGWARALGALFGLRGGFFLGVFGRRHGSHFSTTPARLRNSTVALHKAVAHEARLAHWQLHLLPEGRFNGLATWFCTGRTRGVGVNPDAEWRSPTIPNPASVLLGFSTASRALVAAAAAAGTGPAPQSMIRGDRCGRAPKFASSGPSHGLQ